MGEFENKRIVELVLYILGKGTLLTQYYVYKILYFAERKHLATWGRGILPREFLAWEKGPVPKKIYGGIKHHEHGDWPLDKLFKEAISRADKDMGDYLIPLREADLSYLSPSEIEAIDKSFEENVCLSVRQLIAKSHDCAWSKARESGDDTVMDSALIACAEGADEEMMAYISETESVKFALER